MDCIAAIFWTSPFGASIDACNSNEACFVTIYILSFTTTDILSFVTSTINVAILTAKKFRVFFIGNS